MALVRRGAGRRDHPVVALVVAEELCVHRLQDVIVLGVAVVGIFSFANAVAIFSDRRS